MPKLTPKPAKPAARRAPGAPLTRKPIARRPPLEGKITIFHADHGVSPATVRWALGQIQPQGFFLRTLRLPAGHRSLRNALYGPASGDHPVSERDVFYQQRSADRPPSRMIDKPTRPTRLLTVIGMRQGPESIVVFTAYGGPAAEREPGDKTLTGADLRAAKAFWRKYALAAR
jgi:hypothetical protein